MRELSYCENPFVYRRRKTREVKVGKVVVGGNQPIRVQSMITCDTMDTEACIGQTMELAAVGCEIVRITAPTVKDAQNLRYIKRDCWSGIAMFRSLLTSISNRMRQWKPPSGSTRFESIPGITPIPKNSPSRSTTTTSICRTGSNT